LKPEGESESALQEVDGDCSGCWRHSDLVGYRKWNERLTWV